MTGLRPRGAPTVAIQDMYTYLCQQLRYSPKSYIFLAVKQRHSGTTALLLAVRYFPSVAAVYEVVLVFRPRLYFLHIPLNFKWVVDVQCNYNISFPRKCRLSLSIVIGSKLWLRLPPSYQYVQCYFAQSPVRLFCQRALWRKCLALLTLSIMPKFARPKHCLDISFHETIILLILTRYKGKGGLVLG